MEGLSQKTSKVLNGIMGEKFLEGYTFIGGSALAVQIKHRLSEDLDFCKWKTRQDENPIVDWKTIENNLLKWEIARTNLLDFNQVDFQLKNGVKVSFYANGLSKSPVNEIVHIGGNIKAASVESIGVMKLELMMRRGTFRDYYDIYCILKEGISLKRMVYSAGKYSGHRLSTKSILSFISNPDNYKKEKDFARLQPKYDVDQGEIGKYVNEKIEEEFSL